MHKALFRSAVVSVIAVFLFPCGSVLAQDTYETELTAGIARTDGPRDYNSTNMGLGFTVFMQEVDPSLGPYAEAAFLNRAGSVSAALSYTEGEGSGLRLKGNRFNLLASFSRAGHPLFARIGYSRDSETLKNISGVSFVANAFSLELGIFPVDGLLLAVGYEKTESELNDQFFGDESWDTDLVSAAAKWVQPLKGDQALNIQAGVTRISDERNDPFEVYTLGGDFYLNQKLGLGAVMRIRDADEGNSEEYVARVSYFPRATIGLNLSFSQFFAHSGVDDGDVTRVMAGINCRF